MSFFNAIIDNFSGRAIGLAFDKKYSVDRLSDNWVDGNGNRLEKFNGTKAALDQRITDMVNDCAAEVHDKNWQISTKTAKSNCRNKIEMKYATEIAAYTAAQADEEAQVKAVALEKNGKLVAGVVIILLVLTAIVIILKLQSK